MTTSTGEYSCAQVEFLLEREASVKVDDKNGENLVLKKINLGLGDDSDVSVITGDDSDLSVITGDDSDLSVITGDDSDGPFHHVDCGCLACSLDQQVFISSSSESESEFDLEKKPQLDQY